jgi:TatD DNase family protein
MLIDTHSHLYLSEFEQDIDQIILRSKTAGIGKVYLPAINSETHLKMIELSDKFPDYCIAMIGLHPCYVKENFKEEILMVEDLLNHHSFSAIGECGLDFYWDKTYINQQLEALEIQLYLSIEKKLPVILHTRNATQETIDIIKKFHSKGVRGIFHCFGGTIEEARQIIELGFYLGIGGVLTYKNAGLDKVLKQIELNHIVLETDSPYLTPVPYRGKRNESSNLKIIATQLAEVKSCSYEEVEKMTTINAIKVFEI